MKTLNCACFLLSFVLKLLEMILFNYHILFLHVIVLWQYMLSSFVPENVKFRFLRFVHWKHSLGEVRDDQLVIRSGFLPASVDMRNPLWQPPHIILYYEFIDMSIFMVFALSRSESRNFAFLCGLVKLNFKFLTYFWSKKIIFYWHAWSVCRCVICWHWLENRHSTKMWRYEIFEMAIFYCLFSILL